LQPGNSSIGPTFQVKPAAPGACLQECASAARGLLVIARTTGMGSAAILHRWMRSHYKAGRVAQKKRTKPIERQFVAWAGWHEAWFCCRASSHQQALFWLPLDRRFLYSSPLLWGQNVQFISAWYANASGPTTKGGSMRQDHRILLPVMVASALTFAGCFSRTKEIDTVPAPAPVVQVNPPVVVPAPGTQTTTTTWNGAAVHSENVPAPVISPPPGTSHSTTTTWGNGAVVQRNTVSEPQPGVVQKQTTTSWNNGAAAPSDETTTTTTTTSP